MSRTVTSSVSAKGLHERRPDTTAAPATRVKHDRTHVTRFRAGRGADGGLDRTDMCRGTSKRKGLSSVVSKQTCTSTSASAVQTASLACADPSVLSTLSPRSDAEAESERFERFQRPARRQRGPIESQQECSVTVHDTTVEDRKDIGFGVRPVRQGMRGSDRDSWAKLDEQNGASAHSRRLGLQDVNDSRWPKRVAEPVERSDQWLTQGNVSSGDRIPEDAEITSDQCLERPSSAEFVLSQNTRDIRPSRQEQPENGHVEDVQRQGDETRMVEVDDNIPHGCEDESLLHQEVDGLDEQQVGKADRQCGQSFTEA